MLCCFPLLQFINDALVCWLAWPAALSAPTDKHNWRWWDFLWDQTLVYTDRNIYFKHCSPASWLSFCLQILAWCICSEPAGTKMATFQRLEFWAVLQVFQFWGFIHFQPGKVSWREKKTRLQISTQSFCRKGHLFSSVDLGRVGSSIPCPDLHLHGGVCGRASWGASATPTTKTYEELQSW